MISVRFLYNGVNIALVVTCLVLIFLLFKFISDKRARLMLGIALVLIIVTGILFPICLKIYSFMDVAQAGELTGKAEKGTMAKVKRFKDVALLGNLLELVAVGLFVGGSKRLISLRTQEGMGKGASQ